MSRIARQRLDRVEAALNPPLQRVVFARGDSPEEARAAADRQVAELIASGEIRSEAEALCFSQSTRHAHEPHDPPPARPA